MLVNCGIESDRGSCRIEANEPSEVQEIHLFYSFLWGLEQAGMGMKNACDRDYNVSNLMPRTHDQTFRQEMFDVSC